ncbi:MAG: SH3 domain-containing protein [Oscillospiraceae bacterium]|nr:SH3 domain-containing protein [Oscillospiraceae bacterium]
MKRICTKLIALILCVATLAGFALPAHATELKTGIGVVTASSLRLRASASTDSKILATASCGDSVVIIREVGDWYLVNFNLEIGYMYKDYIEFNEKKNIKLGYAMFDSSSNVRKGPGTNTDVVAQAPKGETCFIIGFNCGWYKVSFNGQIGYVRSDLLTLLETPYTNAGSKGNTYKESSSGKKSGSSSSSSSSSSASTLGEQVAAYAMQFKGYKYVYGGATPSDGFDCSGMVYYIYKQFGYNVGRTCTNQYNSGYSRVTRGNLKVGDIVLFERTYTTNSYCTHSGIYIGNGQFIHAANSHSGVVVTSLDNEYYSSRFVCGVHVG